MTQHYRLHKISTNIYIQSIREAFICLIPYLILISALTLLTSSVQALNLLDPTSGILKSLLSINRSTYLLFPLVTMLALSYTLAKNLAQPPIACAILALACFINLNNELVEIERIINGGYFDIQPYAMILPFIVTLSLKNIRQIVSTKLIVAPSISSHLQVHINLIIPYILTFALTCTVLLALNPLFSELLTPLAEALQNSSLFVRGLCRTVVSNLLWFLGIHGDNTYNLIADPWLNSEMVGDNLLMARLHDYFILIGGSGSGLSLILAILLFSKDERSLKIAKISLPFALFNINELLIFGLPIVFNPYLLIPFIFVPALLYCCAYASVTFQLITFIPHDMSWITPPLINTFIAGSDLKACLFQFALLILGASIYAPFVRMSHLYNHDREVAQELADKLSINAPEQEEIDSRHSKTTPPPKNQLDDSALLEEILAGQLFLQYQPIINSSDFSLMGFEVQTYLHRSDGKLMDAKSLEQLNSSSIVEVIQLWQSKQLQQELSLCRSALPDAEIFIKLNRATTRHPRLIKKLSIDLIQQREKLHLALGREILEDNLQLQTNLKHILNAGIKISLTDNDSTSLPINTIFNNSITEITLPAPIFIDQNGETIEPNKFKQLTTLNQNLGHSVRITGISKRNELSLAVLCKADQLQGDLFSPPIPIKKLIDFSQHWQYNSNEIRQQLTEKL